MEECCYTCEYCDFYEVETDDIYEYWACDLGREEFDYENGGPCDYYE